jgi:uncharacterized membrane protein
MKTISKLRNHSRNISLVTFCAFLLSSAVVIGGIFPTNVSAEEKEAKHVAALQSSEKNNTAKKENKEQVKEDQEVESITYSLDDGSVAGAYGDGVYGH